MLRYIALLSLTLGVASCTSKPTINQAPPAVAQANPPVAALAEVGGQLVDTSYATAMYRLKDQYSVIMFFKRDHGGASSAFCSSLLYMKNSDEAPIDHVELAGSSRTVVLDQNNSSITQVAKGVRIDLTHPSIKARCAQLTGDPFANNKDVHLGLFSGDGNAAIIMPPAALVLPPGISGITTG